MPSPRIIVIGASAGGFEALQTLVAGLPKGLPASIFVVWHMAPEVRGILPYVLNKYDTLPAANACDGEEIEVGRIYVAPPDRHMLLERGRIRITRGPKENRFRPAVDPLFRSAAYVYGEQVIGIVLSGALDDGTSGLWIVKRRGGIAIVQHPRDAAVSAMPENAMRAVKVDYSLAVADMPALLERLCTEPLTISDTIKSGINMEENSQTEREIRIAKGEQTEDEQAKAFGELTPFSCPECHGVLSALHDGGRTRYRCHTGHAYSADSLLTAITESIDDGLWSAIRGIEESMMLLNHMGDHYAEANQTNTAAKFFQKAKEASERLAGMKTIVTANEQLSIEGIAEAE